MTYCVAMRLNAGMVLLADSRTNAGVDQINTFRKMTVFERTGERVIVLMTSGNLAITQAVRQELHDLKTEAGDTIWTVRNMHAVAQLLGCAARKVHARDAESLKEFNVDFSASFILGGQIAGEGPRLFQAYAAGNFIEAGEDCPYFQIGEAKYGKPIIDRVVNPRMPLDEAAKCALISMDSTVRSNISVGLPLDLMVYETDSLAVTRFARIDETNKYYQMIRNSWGQKLQQVFDEIPDPSWIDQCGSVNDALRGLPLRVVSPDSSVDPVPSQTLAQQS